MLDWEEVAAKACSAYGASQRPTELANVLRLVAAISPRIILEIGCDRGGTLWAWRQACERVYGITLADNGHDAGGSGHDLETHGAEVFVGDSHSDQAHTWVRQQLGKGGLLDVLVIDGDHSAKGVLEDHDKYGPWVRPGGLILLHDIAVTSDARAQVHLVWPELRTRYPYWTEVRDRDSALGWGIVRTREPL